jgi:hypothetical protein
MNHVLSCECGGDLVVSQRARKTNRIKIRKVAPHRCLCVARTNEREFHIRFHFAQSPNQLDEPADSLLFFNKATNVDKAEWLRGIEIA